MCNVVPLVRVGPKQTFLTPFSDGIWNFRQVSVGDRGFLPTRPRNRRGYALLAHMLGKMRSCATGERLNMVIRTVVLKTTIIQAKSFPVVSTSHTVSPRSFSFVCTFHTVHPRNTFPLVCTSHTVNPRCTKCLQCA